MSENGDKLVQFSTYVRESDPLYMATMEEKKRTGLGVSNILRVALTEYHRHRGRLQRLEKTED